MKEEPNLDKWAKYLQTCDGCKKPCVMYEKGMRGCKDKVTDVDIKDLAIKIGEAGEAFERAYNGQDRIVTVTMTSKNAKRLAEYVKREQDKEPCPDCVSREAVTNILIKRGVHFCDIVAITSDIKDLPTVQPTKKRGHWYYDEERGATGIYAICSACEEEIYQTGDFKYCPNCGAEMEAAE